jgi:hypothetical protein
MIPGIHGGFGKCQTTPSQKVPMTVLGIGWESENPRQIPKFLDDSVGISVQKGATTESIGLGA